MKKKKKTYIKTIGGYYEWCKKNRTEVSTRHIHRCLADGTIVTEPRKKGPGWQHPFKTDQTSLDALGNQECNIYKFKDAVKVTALSERTLRNDIKSGKLKRDKFLGRTCFTANSMYYYLKEHHPECTTIFLERVKQEGIVIDV